MENKKKKKDRAIYSVDPLVIKERAEKFASSPEQRLILETFANRLNDELEKKQISQLEFAKKLNIATGTLSNYRTAFRVPDIWTLLDIAKALNVSVDYLLGFTDLKSPNSNYKEIHNITGLNDEAINQLKDYVDFINDKETLPFLKDEIEDRIKAINYLIANDNDSRISSTIASFLWYEYNTNIDEVMSKNAGTDISKIYQPDVDEARKLLGNCVFLDVKNRNANRGINIEDISKFDFILLESQLTKLKEKYNMEKDK